MKVVDLRARLNTWASVIRKQEFKEANEYFKQIAGLIKTTTESGHDDIAQSKLDEILDKSPINFLTEQPPEFDKFNSQLIKKQLNRFFADFQNVFNLPQFIRAFKNFNELELTYSDRVKNSNTAVMLSNERIFAKQALNDTFFECVCVAQQLPFDASTRVPFDEIIEENWERIAAVVAEYIKNKELKENIDNMDVPISNDKLIQLIKEANWLTAKDGMKILCRSFAVAKRLLNNRQSDCYWILQSIMGGTGKSIWLDGEMKYLSSLSVQTHLADQDEFGSGFSNPEAFQKDFLYINEDDKWDDATLRHKKKAVEREPMIFNRKYGARTSEVPICLITSTTNKTVYETNRRFQKIKFGRHVFGDDVPFVEKNEAIDKTARVHQMLIEGIVARYKTQLPKLTTIAAATQFSNYFEDERYPAGLILRAFRELLKDRFENSADQQLQLEDLKHQYKLLAQDKPVPEKLMMNQFKAKIMAYRKGSEEAQIWSTEAFWSKIRQTLESLIESKQLKGIFKIGMTIEFDNRYGSTEQVASKRNWEAILIEDVAALKQSIDVMLEEDSKKVIAIDEEVRFETFATKLLQLLDTTTDTSKELPKFAKLIECKDV